MNDQPSTHQPAARSAQRKPYQKPAMEPIALRVKDDVLATCRTSSSASPGNSCKITPCFT